MKTVTPMDLRRSLGSILDEASAGQRFLIEREHRPLAVIVSVEDAARLEEDPEQAQRRHEAAIDALIEWRDRVKPSVPDGLSAVEWLRRDRDTRDQRHRQVITDDADHSGNQE